MTLSETANREKWHCTRGRLRTQRALSGFVQKVVAVDAVITKAVSTQFPCLTGNLQGKYTFWHQNRVFTVTTP